jgi:hypothetical protein
MIAASSKGHEQVDETGRPNVLSYKQIFKDGKMGHEPHVLETPPEARANPASRRQRRDIVTVNRYPAAIDGEHAADCVE